MKYTARRILYLDPDFSRIEDQIVQLMLEQHLSWNKYIESLEPLRHDVSNYGYAWKGNLLKKVTNIPVDTLEKQILDIIYNNRISFDEFVDALNEGLHSLDRFDCVWEHNHSDWHLIAKNSQHFQNIGDVPVIEDFDFKEFLHHKNNSMLFEYFDGLLGLPLPHGPLIGEGAEGEVFLHGPDKVFKIATTYCQGANVDGNIKHLQAFAIFLKSAKPSCVAQLFDFIVHGKFFQPGCTKPFYVYTSVAERLYPIAYGTDISTRKILNAALLGQLSAKRLAQYPAFAAKINAFRDSITKLPFHLFDTHIGNVMQDRQGNFKLVDMGFAYER